MIQKMDLYKEHFNMPTGREQKLVDIMFEIAIMLHTNPYMKDKTVEELAAWVVDQLKKCGFETQPCGGSWAVLKN